MKRKPKMITKRGSHMRLGAGWRLTKLKRGGEPKEFVGTLLYVHNPNGKQRTAIFSVPKRGGNEW